MSNENRYVLLDRRYLLRGWQDIPYALVDSLGARAAVVSKSVFDTLQLCNGRFRASDPMFIGVRREHLERFEQEGILRFCDEAVTLDPEQGFRRYPNCFLREIQWSMTGACNYRCRHCYMSAPHARFSQPSTQEALRIVDQMADCGILSVRLTGGEALVRRDFLEIVEHLCERGIRVATIMSNGALVTEELLLALKDLNVRCRFDMSFDGTGGWHDWLRGVDGAEEEVLRAFALCREHGFSTGSQYTLHKGNISVLRESVRILGELGVSAIKVGPIDVEGEARGLVDYALAYDELLDACERYLPQYYEDGMPVPRISFGRFFEIADGVVSIPYEHYSEQRDCSRQPTCGTVRTCMYLTSDGYALPCIPFSYADDYKRIYPGLHEKTLPEVLTDSSYRDFMVHTLGDYLEHNQECQACTYRNRCAGGCRASGYIESGYADAMAPDREACRFFRDGYYDQVKAYVEGLGVKTALR